MTDQTTTPDATFAVPNDLDPGTVGAVHAGLVAALGTAGDTAPHLVLQGDGPVSPLSLQLLASARKACSDLTFCETAQACLSAADRQMEK